MAVKKVNLKSQLVLGIREIGYYNNIKELLKKLYPYAASRGIKITGSPIFIFHGATAEKVKKADKEGRADIEVCVPVKQSMEINDEGMELRVAFYELKGGKFAKISHKGPYEKCKETYDELFLWINEKGYRVSGPIREVHKNDPDKVEPKELITEVYIPIEKGKENKKLLKEEIKSRYKDYKESFIHKISKK